MLKKITSMATAVLMMAGGLSVVAAPTASAAACNYVALGASSSIKGATVTSVGTGAATIAALVADSSLHGSVTMDSVRATGGSMTMLAKDLSHSTDNLYWSRFTSAQDPSSWNGTGTDMQFSVQYSNGDKLIVKAEPSACDVIYYWIDVTVTAASTDATLASGQIKGVAISNFGTPNSTISSVTPGAVSISTTASTDGTRATSFTKTEAGGTSVAFKKFSSGANPDATQFQAASSYTTGNLTSGDIIIVLATAADTSSKLYYKFVVTVSDSPSSSSSSDSGAAAAQAAAAAVVAAKSSLVTTLKAGKPVTAADLSAADMAIASAKAAVRVNAKILALPAEKRADLATLQTLVRTENFVDKVSTETTQMRVTSRDLVVEQLIPADYKYKASVIRAIIAENAASLDSIEKVEAVVKAAVAAIQARKDRLAAIIAKINGTK